MTTTHPASRSRHPSARPAGKGGPPGRRSSSYVALLLITVTLTLLGLVMVLSASSVSDLQTEGSSWHSFLRQLTWTSAGVGATLVTLRVDYHWWRRHARLFLGVAFGLLGLVLVPGIGVTVNGATRWLGAGSFTIQPGEFVKLALLVWVADLLARRMGKVRDARATLRPVLLALGLCALLLLLQPNLGTLLVVAAMVLVVLYVAGTPLHRMLGLGALATGGAVALTLLEGFRRARLLAFLDPWADPLNTGYQSIQSMVGIASGGLTGVGLGASRAKWGFLPYAHTDFIFAIIAEELGLLGAGTVLLLFGGLAVVGLRVALEARDDFGRLLAAGITTWFVVQAVLNIGSVVSVMPVTGVPLPFVSFGGSSMVVTLAATGLLLNVARHRRPPARRRPA